MADKKLWTEQEVKQVFDLYRRGNDLPSGDFPRPKNGLKPTIHQREPGYMVDWATLEYMRSQVKDKSQELPVDDETLDAFQERITQLREEFKGRSVLSAKVRTGLMEHMEEVVKQGEIANIFYEEARKHDFDADKTMEATRSYYERVWPALERGYSVQDIRRGEHLGESDLNGPEGKVFEPRNEARSSLPGQPRSTKQYAASSGIKRAAAFKASARSSNPFSTSNPDLRQQAMLLEKNPSRARKLIIGANRDPEMFKL
jgi:hypothetical protein